MEIAQYITVDPPIHHGTPVITGTRVPISIIIGSLAGGMSKEEVMQEYELTKTQVEAALSYGRIVNCRIQFDGRKLAGLLPVTSRRSP